MPALYFIRHGETDWNKDGRLQGQTDIPLNKRGRMQADIAGKHLVSPSAVGLSPERLAQMQFVSSPLIRTRQTMEILRASLKLDPMQYVTDARLKEITFGTWEGKTWPEIRARDPIGASARDRDKWGYVPPGGENYAMVLERVSDWLASLQEDCCVVAHGGIARVILVALAGTSHMQAVASDIWQGKVLAFENGAARWVPGPGHH